LIVTDTAVLLREFGLEAPSDDRFRRSLTDIVMDVSDPVLVEMFAIVTGSGATSVCFSRIPPSRRSSSVTSRQELTH
jgi:hypothetical protein